MRFLPVILLSSSLVSSASSTMAWIATPNNNSQRGLLRPATAASCWIISPPTTTTRLVLSSFSKKQNRRRIGAGRRAHPSISATSTTQLDLVPPGDCISEAYNNLGADANSVLVAAAAAATEAPSESSSWRQYVPLVVSCAVIADILLGSPAASAAIGLLNRREPEAPDAAERADNDRAAAGGGARPSSLFDRLTTSRQQQRGGKSSSNSNRQQPKERIDTQQLAQAAIEKAKNTLELQQYLENAKTDYDRMEELKRNMDAQAAQLDRKLEERRQGE